MTKVLVYSPFSLAYGGGGERWIREVFGRLKDTYDVQVLTTDFTGEPGNEKVPMSADERKQVQEKLNWHTISSKWYQPGVQLLPPKSLFQLRRGIAQADIVFFNSIPVQDVLVQFAALGCSTPIVNVFQSPPMGHTRLTKLYEQSIMRTLAPRYDAQYVLNDYTETLLDGFGCENIFKIPNGVDTTRFSPTFRHEEEHNFRVLFVGNLNKQKGADLLPAIFSRVFNESSQITLTVVGSGKFSERIQNFAKQWPTRVEYKGQLSHEALSTIYANHELLILPSRAEGLPLVGAEAQASGTPVLASDQQGARDVVSQGVSGYVVPLDPGQIAAKIVDLKNTWEKKGSKYDVLRTQVREFAEQRYDWENIAEEVGIMIENIMKKR